MKVMIGVKGKDIYTQVNKIKKLCERYLTSVDSIGNECAWTDRMVEDIISSSEHLKHDYESQFELNKS